MSRPQASPWAAPMCSALPQDGSSPGDGVGSVPDQLSRVSASPASTTPAGPARPRRALEIRPIRRRSLPLAYDGIVARVLVTGGAGFVGANLAIALATRHPDWELVAFDNLYRRGRGVNPPPVRRVRV